MYSPIDAVASAEPGGCPPAGLADRLAECSTVRYIKLGRGGAWAADAFASATVPFGYREIAHEPCSAGDWDAVRAQLAAAGWSRTGVTAALRELRDFYSIGDECLWMTFASGHLWWAFAEPEVVAVPDTGDDAPRRFRRTLGGWQRHSLTGEPLALRTLSSALTRVAGYRMTICTVERKDYLLRHIRGEVEPLVLEARRIGDELQSVAAKMIAQLDWRDFEIMTEMIFTRGGWQRQSAIGDGEVDIDLLLDSPTTGESAWVQVKSRASQRVLDDYLERFRADGSCDRFYFVVHSPTGNLGVPDGRGVHLWAGGELARHALAAGLFEWLVQRTG